MTDNRTRLQKLTDIMIGASNGAMQPTQASKTYAYNIAPGSDIVFSSNSKAERDMKLKQMKQERLMAYEWKKIGYETSVEQLQGLSQVRVMYRDADLMSAWPEIGTALSIIAEEATTVNKKGKILNIYSESPRIQSVLEDLFINRLDFNTWGRTITRATAKYGNEFMFLNITLDNGIIGWRELPVHEMTRIEGGLVSAYSGGVGMIPPAANLANTKPDEVKFVWEGHNQQLAYKNWQIAHFRLINDSLFLPYGVSWLNPARRHWRMLSMMEDGMLLYRLERSVERRIFKVNVGLIDDADVPAYLQEFMNTFKRAPIIDPQTGQIDLRKNFLDVSADYVIPVRSGQDPSSIENLQPAQNPTSMDDIQFIENKVLCALRVPKSFLGFQEAMNKAQNLSLIDVRFNRMVNGVQQAILMELNKIAMIHLYLLGFEDDLTNFTLTLNNPSNQIEMMELDNLNKRLQAATTALAEQGTGIPLMSWHAVQREIMGRTDKEISEMLDELRIENALSIELQKTPEIIERTGFFDKVDRIYGKPGAKYSKGVPGENGGLGGPGGGMAPIGGGFGDDLGDLGEPGADDMGDIGGEEGAADLDSMGDEGGSQPLNENVKRMLQEYRKLAEKEIKNREEISNPRIAKSLKDSSFFINEEIDDTIKSLGELISESKAKIEDKDLEDINETITK